MITLKKNQAAERQPSWFHTVPLLVMGCLLLTACGEKQSGNAQPGSFQESLPPEATEPRPSDGVRRVTIPELREALAKGEALVIDVRGEVDYKLGHIKGARSVPLGLIDEKAKELPRDKLLVTYCA